MRRHDDDDSHVTIRWGVYRQDDNGNVFLVCEFDDEAAARARVAEFEARWHKQTYWYAPLE